jgi:hypothetical protein
MSPAPFCVAGCGPSAPRIRGVHDFIGDWRHIALRPHDLWFWTQFLNKMETIMRRMLLIALLAAVLGCAKNPNSEAAGARIHDTTLTARDTIDPNDTLPRIRDTVPDSTRH